MGQVALDINGRRFHVACDDGQEEHVRELAAYVDGKVRRMAEEIGQVGEPRLLVMASLLIADELYEARNAAGQGPPKNAPTASAVEERAAEALEGAAERLQDIAARLEAT
jgi:cell division protein ZapA